MMRPSSSSSSSCRSSLLPPTPTKPTYVRLGIGGAGNIHKASSLPPYSPQSLSPTPSHHSCPSTAGSSPSAAGPRSSYQSTIAPLLPSGRQQQQKTHYTSGIGGAGNIHAYSERSAVDAAEEVARARAVALRVNRGNGGPWHVGIGGAGNAAARLRSRKSEAALCKAAAARNERMVTMVREEERAAAAAHYSSIEKEKDVLVSGDDIDSDVRYTSQAAFKREPVSYSAEPLPYGALDLLRRQISQTFGTGGSSGSGSGHGNRAARVGQTDEKRRNHCADEQQQQPRRTLRSHRSLWRF